MTLGLRKPPALCIGLLGSILMVWAQTNPQGDAVGTAAPLVSQHYSLSWMLDHTANVTAADGDTLYFRNSGLPGNRVGTSYDVLLRASRVSDPVGQPIEISVSRIGELVISDTRSDYFLGKYKGQPITPDLIKSGTVFCVFIPTTTFTEETFDQRTCDLEQRSRTRNQPSASESRLRNDNSEAMSSSTPTVQVDAEIAEADLVFRVAPVYPPLAKAAHVQGSVKFRVTVEADGHVSDAQLIGGPPLLVQAASRAVRQWVYKPRLVDGKAVNVVTTVVVSFTLTK